MISNPTSRTGAGTSALRAPAAPIRVLVADDHTITLWGLQQLIESAAPQMTVAGTARSLDELLRHPALDDTDVVLLDIDLGGADSLHSVPALVERHGVKIVVLTGDTNLRQHRDAVLRGARGVVLKSDPTGDVLQAIECVHRGEPWIGRALMSELLCAMPGATPAARPTERRDAGLQSLTPKELQVVKAIVRHRGSKSLVVAESLGMSEHTLRNHLTVIYSKLHVQGKLNLYAYALEHGLTPEPDASPR